RAIPRHVPQAQAHQTCAAGRRETVHDRDRRDEGRVQGGTDDPGDGDPRRHGHRDGALSRRDLRRRRHRSPVRRAARQPHRAAGARAASAGTARRGAAGVDEGAEGRRRDRHRVESPRRRAREGRRPLRGARPRRPAVGAVSFLPPHRRPVDPARRAGGAKDLMFRYTLQQRVVASDCELPLLAPASGAADADLVLRLDARSSDAPQATPWYRGPSMAIEASAAGGRVLRFDDGTSFLVAADGRAITVLSAPAHYTRDDLAAYALGPVLGIALHLQGAVLLHAAAVVMRGRAIVIAGGAGSGKSTTAAILHRDGYEILA